MSVDAVPVPPQENPTQPAASAASAALQHAVCGRCQRVLSAERPMKLPDNRVYCVACCESMAAGDFEMETGESFSKWMEKRDGLVMKYQPLEISVRRMGLFFPLTLSALGPLVIIYGFTHGSANWGGFLFTGLMMHLFFGYFAFRGAKAYLRALNYELRLKNGVFELTYGQHHEKFSADDVTQACVVRPGTVGATEGALRLKDGRMLTLDTCLSDLHALGVVMDLRFREDFPPSLEDLARLRREKLRKIRGLSD